MRAGGYGAGIGGFTGGLIGGIHASKYGKYDPGDYDSSGKKVQVDIELEALGIDPKGVPDFHLKSLERIKPLPSIDKLLKMVPVDPKIELVGFGQASSHNKFRKGIVRMSNRNFVSWRRLATAFGHELVHRVNNSVHWFDLRDNNLLNTDMSFPYNYNEALAHYWSTSYSGTAAHKLYQHINATSPLLKSHFHNHAIYID